MYLYEIKYGAFFTFLSRFFLLLLFILLPFNEVISIGNGFKMCIYIFMYTSVDKLSALVFCSIIVDSCQAQLMLGLAPDTHAK